MVGYEDEMVFYYPYVPDEEADVLILVNKTGPIHGNGDVSLSMNVQANSNLPYFDWDLPTGRKNTARSRTFDPVQPEIINMEHDRLRDACSDKLADCTSLINVRGQARR